MNTPTHFQEHLHSELRHVVAENESPRRQQRPIKAPIGRRPLALSGAGLVAEGAVAAIVVASSTGVTTNAYAVESHGNSVTVHVRALSDAAGLQASLRAAGVAAIVNYGPAANLPACPAPEGPTVTRPSGSEAKGPEGPSGARSERPGVSRSASGGAASLLPSPPRGATAASSTVQVTPDGVTFTVDPGSIKPDQQLVITTSGRTLASIGMAVVARSAGACSAAPPPQL
jgi:hypothetical protein